MHNADKPANYYSPLPPKGRGIILKIRIDALVGSFWITITMASSTSAICRYRNNATLSSGVGIPGVTTIQNSVGVALMEGPLSKWTNVMKGWQFRWFVLDENTGLLSYYT
ncbi:Oxysterol-binding protein-related protein 9, partial [Orchesella cincta]